MAMVYPRLLNNLRLLWCLYEGLDEVEARCVG